MSRQWPPGIPSPGPLEPDHDRKLRKRREAMREGAFRLEREVERQDACGYRDWEKLVAAVFEGLDPLDLM